MLVLRFDLMEDVFGAHCHAAVAAPLKRRVSLAPCVSPEWCVKHTSTSSTVAAATSALDACCGDLLASVASDPAMDDEQDKARQHMATTVSEPLDFSFGGNGEGFDEDFDLGPPPPSGPILVRQRAMDWTVAREAKVASVAQKLDTAGATPSGAAAALRTARLIPPSSSSRRFMGV